MLTADCLIHIGKILSTHGYKGQFKVRVNEKINFDLDKGSVVFLKIHHKPVPFIIEEISLTYSDLLYISVKDITSREEGQEYIDIDVYIHEDRVKSSELNADIFSSLDGYLVKDQYDNNIGEIIRIQDNFNQFVLELKYKDKTILVPFHNDLLIMLDEDNKIIKLEIPEGLLDI